ncbi:MAG: CDP-alcohol phosphatidyltransferase family protein [Faecousia sp.]
MFIKDWKKEVFTIPNLLSLFRLVLIPVYAYIYLNATENYQYLIAGSIMAVSCITDMVDGKIARRYNMISNLGKILDPLADKITQFTLTLCLSLKYPVLRPVLCLFIVKEIFQAVMGIIHLRKGRMLPGALMAGKVCTTILFISLIALVLFPNMNPRFVDAIAAVDTVFLVISFISYIFAYLGKNTKVQDLKTE